VLAGPWRSSPQAATAVLKGLATDTAEEVLRCMQASQLEVNQFHCTCVISSCRRSDGWQQALGILAQMPACYSVQASLASYNAAMAACSRAGQWQVALELLQAVHEKLGSLAPSAISYSTAIGACAQAGQWQLALELLFGFSDPDEFMYGAAISACEKGGGQWDKALGLLSHLSMASRRIPLNVIIHNSAISACEKAGRWRCALELLHGMPRRKLTPNVVSYSAAASACEKGAQAQGLLSSQWRIAMILLNNMQELRVTSNAITYNSAISTCEKGGQWQQAVLLLRNMAERMIAPTDISYSAAMSACKAACQWQVTQSLLTQMPTGLVASGYNAAISCFAQCKQWQLAVSVLRRMPGLRVAPDEISFTSAVSACEEAKKWELSLNLLTIGRAASTRPRGREVEDLAPAELLALSWRLAKQKQSSTSRSPAAEREARQVAEAAALQAGSFRPKDLASLLWALAESSRLWQMCR
ncbi:unnamed protein product, partial [Polarella glacialis]